MAAPRGGVNLSCVRTSTAGAKHDARYLALMLPIARALPLFAVAAALHAGLAAPLRAQDLRGHGGPVRALAVSPDGKTAISGSFDQSAILWTLDSGRAKAILRAHDGAVNAVAALPDGRFATAGEDGRIALWPAQDDTPLRMSRVHKAPIAGLAVSPDGAALASAGWDGQARVTAVSDGRLIRTLAGHKGNVNAVAFLPDGRLASAGYDATLRFEGADGGVRVIETASPLNALVALPHGRLVAGGASGDIFIVDPRTEAVASLPATDTPIIALAASPDGASIAAASPRGAVAIIDVASRKIRFTLNGPGLPVWSLAYTPDGRTLLTGGGDRLVRRWDAATGEHLGAILATKPADDLTRAGLAHLADTRGAEVFRACAVCHTLRPDDENRAGPTLYGVFGRKAGTAPGYNYSAAFRQLDITWTADTISKLFEIGPQAYTPGTKMPEQTVGNAQDRAALITFLERATRPAGGAPARSETP